MNKITPFGTKIKKTLFEEWETLESILWFLMGILAAMFLLSLFSDTVAEMLRKLIGAKEKTRVLEFIGFGMGGILAAIGAIAINRRADAQVKSAEAQAESAKAQVDNNKLIEKGHIQDRFKAATEHLGHERPGMRIAAYYEFYQLAKQYPDWREHVLDILCAHLRQVTTDENYKGKGKPTEEVQTLLDLLFKSKDKSIFQGLKANLQRVNLVGASLFDVHMPNTDFTFACLIGADMRYGKFHNCRFSGARMDGVWLDLAEMVLAFLSNASLRGSRLQNTNMQMAQLGNGTDFRGSYLSKTKMQRPTIISTMSIPSVFMGGAFCCTNSYEDYESIINKQQGESGSPDIISDGGLSENGVRKTVEFLTQYSDKNLAEEYEKCMQELIDQPRETDLPSGCDLKEYTQEDANQWINEYKKATGE